MNSHSAQSGSYSFRVWLLAVAVGPILTLITWRWTSTFSLTDIVQLLGFDIVFMFIGAILSFPSFLLLWLSTYLLLLVPMYNVSRKIILTIIGSTLAWAPFIVLGLDDLVGHKFVYVPYVGQRCQTLSIQ